MAGCSRRRWNVKMSRRRVAIVLAVIVMTTSGVALSGMWRAPDQAVSAAAEVQRVERELVAAIAKGDLVTYDRIVADDYVAIR